MLTQRTIGAAANEIGVTPSTLRIYERLGLLKPRRDSSGKRLYNDREIAQARKIRQQRLTARGSGLPYRARPTGEL